MTKVDGGQQRYNQPTKGSAKAGGDGGGNWDSDGSGKNSDGDATVQWQQQRNGAGDVRQWTV